MHKAIALKENRDCTKRFCTLISTIPGNKQFFDPKIHYKPFLILPGSASADEMALWDHRVNAMTCGCKRKTTLNPHYYAIFCASLNMPCKNDYRYLYMDNLATHQNQACVEMLTEKKMILRNLVIKSTHLNQPVDQNVGNKYEKYVQSMFVICYIFVIYLLKC